MVMNMLNASQEATSGTYEPISTFFLIARPSAFFFRGFSSSPLIPLPSINRFHSVLNGSPSELPNTLMCIYRPTGES